MSYRQEIVGGIILLLALPIYCYVLKSVNSPPQSVVEN